MKIEFIKDHPFFHAKAGDVQEFKDEHRATVLIAAGYAKEAKDSKKHEDKGQS